MRDVEDTDKEDGSNKHDVAEAHHEQGPGHLHLTTLDLLPCLENPVWTHNHLNMDDPGGDLTSLV